MIKISHCPHCGDTFKVPDELEENFNCTCFRCGGHFSLHSCSTEEFILLAIKNTKP